MSLVTRHFVFKVDGKPAEVEVEVYSNGEIPEGANIEFLSKGEIADDLLERIMTGEEKAEVSASPIDELNCITRSLGSFIRNTYGLWLKPHPYANTRNSSADNFTENISKEIIEMIQQRLA